MATPALRIRIAPKFPTKQQAGVGLAVSRTGGVVTYRQDWSAVQDVVTPENDAEVLIRDPGDGQFYRTGLSGLADFIRPVASQSEAEAGTNNTKTMTPLRTKESIVENAHLGVWSATGTGAASRTFDDRFADLLDLKDYYRPDLGDTDYTQAFQRIAALAATNLCINLPVGDIPISDAVLFTDKSLTLLGKGSWVTRLRYTAQAAKIGFLDTSTTSGAAVHCRLNVFNLTALKDHSTTAGNGGTAIEATWSYTGITASWEHATFENVTIQGTGTNFWNVGIKLTDVGCARFNNVRFDNGGADISNSRAGLEIVRDKASALTGFQAANCFYFGWMAGIRITHKNAVQDGTIEGIYIGNQETVGVGYGVYDDNESSPTANRSINGLHYQGHISSSRAAMCFGHISGLFLDSCNWTFNNLADASPALEAGIIARGSAQGWRITGGRFVRGTGAATGKPFLLLPTAANVDHVRVIGPSVEGFGSVVDQVGTAATTVRSLFLSAVGTSSGVTRSTTASGFWNMAATGGVATAVDGDTINFGQTFSAIPGVTCQHRAANGTVVVKPYNLTTSSFQVYSSNGAVSVQISWSAVGPSGV